MCCSLGQINQSKWFVDSETKSILAFSEIELLLWPFLQKLSLSEARLDKQVVISSILASDSIQFHWSMINVDIPDPNQSERLLTDIINKWATICVCI